MAKKRSYSTTYRTSSGRGSSRLLKKEEKKMRQQTVLYVFFGIVLIALFIFVIVPNLIRLFFAFIDQDSPFEMSDDVPPQVPILAQSPPEATYSAKLKLSGFAEPESTVVFVLNGVELNQAEVSQEGEFEQDLALEEGDNELTLYGLDQAGNESLQSKSYRVSLDQEAPGLTIIKPEADSLIELKKNRNTIIEGETEPLAKVYLNERLILADSEGKFSSTYYLSEGDNELKFVAIDKAGNQTEAEIKVEFRQ